MSTGEVVIVNQPYILSNSKVFAKQEFALKIIIIIKKKELAPAFFSIMFASFIKKVAGRGGRNEAWETGYML